MRKIITTLLSAFFLGNIFAVTPVWDILNKSMAAWNTDDGDTYNRAWSLSKGNQITGDVVFQESGYVNITKTQTFNGNRYALLVPAAVTVVNNVAYSIEVTARLQAIDKVAFPDITPPPYSEAKVGGFESNQISARLRNRVLVVHLKHGDGEMGYLTINPNVDPAEADRYYVSTAEWHTYRFLLHADNLSYDVFIDDVELPIFKNVATVAGTGSNILRLGAETTHRCSMDIQTVKMGTGDFYTDPKISSVTLDADNHEEGNEATLLVTANTAFINDGQPLIFSLLDDDDADVVTPVIANVTDNVATGSIVIPSTVTRGQYTVKVSVEDDKIGEYTIVAKTKGYEIKADPTSIQEDAIEESVSLSANVLTAGQAVIVKSNANELVISEVSLYSVAGNEIDRKTISAEEGTIVAPNAQGVYVMNVKLSNNVSKTFKVLVK